MKTCVVHSAEAENERLRLEIGALFGRNRHQRTSSLRSSMVSHYELRKRIGAGAKGTVYLARDQHLNRSVAIKILRRQHAGDEESRHRFFREARCASALNHPNIVTVYELGHDQGTDFVVMEYLDGQTLDRVTPRQGLDLEICLDYALQMTRAVAAAHLAGIAHRDLKPSNFLVANNGTIKLLDFGLAKVIACRLARLSRDRRAKDLETRDGTILGTVGYMSSRTSFEVRGRTGGRMFSAWVRSFMKC